VRAIGADISRFVSHEASSDSEWPAQKLELRFGFDEEPESLPALELPDGVRVRGVIDRVDVEPGPPSPGSGSALVPASTVDDGSGARRAIVRDYKTGGTRPEYQGARWEADRQLQVPLYMLAAAQLLGLQPVAGFYQPLGGDDLRARGVFVEGAPVGSEVVRTDARTPEDIQATLDAAAERAAELAAGLRAGRLAPRPETCSRCGCAYPGICRAG
jgi:RecB family exonuclease